MTFNGFPPQAFDFYVALNANNTKLWWNEHKGEYETFVKVPLTELMEALESEFGAFKIYRPYRDARFSKDKTPIKDHQGAVIMIEDNVGYYVQVSATGLMVAGGWYAPAGKQLERYRKAIDSAAGVELERMLKEIEKRYETNGNPLKTKPKGYDADHPRIELLRNRSLTFAKNYDGESWIGTQKALTVIRKDWRAFQSAMEWLADHVGPGEEPE